MGVLYYLSRRRLPGERNEITGNLRKAHTIQQLNMCQGFAAAEDVCFVSPGNGGSRPSWETIADCYNLSSRFELKAVPAPGQNYQFPNYPVPDLDTQVVTYWLVYAYLSGRFEDGDIVYSRNLPATRYFLKFRELVGADDDIAVWFEQHQVERKGDDDAFGNGFYDQLDGLVCISERQNQEVVAAHSIQPSKTLVAHDGANLDAYEGLSTTTAREQLGFDPDEPIVMYTGHLYPSKDVETLLDAAADFDAHCYIVGGYDDDIDRLQTNHSIPDNVTFTGFVPPSDVPAYQTAADVLVATVAADPERDYFSPLKLFEYMAAGKPMVVTRKPEFQEVLTHEHDALFVEPESASKLAEKISVLLSDSELRQYLGRRARENVQGYAWEIRAKRILHRIRNGF